MAGRPPDAEGRGASPVRPEAFDDWSGAAAYVPTPDGQELDYNHPAAAAAILALQPAGWQEEDGGRTLVFWLEDGAEARPEVAAGLRRLGGFGRLEVARERPGWEDAWRRFHRPHVIGRLYVRPPWYPARDDLLDVAVEAGLAFGTGGHASTRECLELIQSIRPASLLDLGSGSGVVSFAALRLGFAPVTGIDIDPVAVHAAAGNAAMNGLAPTFLVGDATDPGYPLPEAAVVVANIALRPILRLAERWRPAGRAGTAPPAGTVAARRDRAASAAPAVRPARRTGRRGAGGLPGLHRDRPHRRRHLADAAPHQAGVMKVAASFVGCKVSQADGEDALAALAAAGLEPVTVREAADVIVVHTCCVTAEAERKSRRLVRRAASAGRRVVVAGCAAALHPEQFEGEEVTVAARPDWSALAEQLKGHRGGGPGEGAAGSVTASGAVGVITLDVIGGTSGGITAGPADDAAPGITPDVTSDVVQGASARATPDHTWGTTGLAGCGRRLRAGRRPDSRTTRLAPLPARVRGWCSRSRTAVPAPVRTASCGWCAGSRAACRSRRRLPPPAPALPAAAARSC